MSRISTQKNIYRNLLDNNIRAEIDLRNESLNHKIREAQMQKIPYMLIIGNKEVENNTVAPRMRNGNNLGAIPLDDFINHVNHECKQELQIQSN